MSISEPTILEAVARYQREYDRYLKLCARVAEICRNEIIEGNAIRAQVTFRAKSAKSLENKLRKYRESASKDMPNVDSVFEKVRDLAAVRIAAYEQNDESKISDALCRRFLGDSGGKVMPDVRDKHKIDSSNFYRATHFEVYLPPPDLVGTYANVDGVPCEIQVCSIMAHVWNEIEHDLGYKPLNGVLSEIEKSMLVNLGHLSRSGDVTISQLLAATDARRADQTDALIDVYDFVARIRRWFPDVDFGRNAGPLFEELQRLRLVTPAGIANQVGDTGKIAVTSRENLNRFVAKLRARGETRFELDDNSADLLLVALLPKLARHILSNHPTGRGVGGPTRISWIASRFLEMENDENCHAEG
jgi:ppGpp synthetase/RelA/SpoT-type nucleotidyltranferase